MPEDSPKSPWRQWSRRNDASKQPRVLVRFTADSGEVWTVWDTTFSKYKNHRHPHCSETARMRVFVNAAGVKRNYTFKRNESRVLDTQELDRQLREASYIDKMPDLSDRKPW